MAPVIVEEETIASGSCDIIADSGYVFSLFDYCTPEARTIDGYKVPRLDLYQLICQDIHRGATIEIATGTFDEVSNELSDEEFTTISCRNSRSNSVVAVVICLLRHGCIQIPLFFISSHIHNADRNLIIHELVKMTFNHLAPDDRCLLACDIYRAWPTIRRYCTVPEQPDQITEVGDNFLESDFAEKLPFIVMNDTKDIKYCMSSINDSQDPDSPLPWLEHYTTPDENENELIDTENNSNDKSLAFAYNIDSVAVMFLRIETDQRHRIKYPAGFHPNNHWKKNKKKLYFPRPQQPSSGGYSRDGGHRGGRGRGRGGRGRGGRGGRHQTTDRRQYRDEDDQGESKAVLLSAAIVSVLVLVGMSVLRIKAV